LGGTVIDSATKNAIEGIGVTCVVNDLDVRKTVTDVNGYFDIGAKDSGEKYISCSELSFADVDGQNKGSYQGKTIENVSSEQNAVELTVELDLIGTVENTQ
jgi:hypothetical protein